MNNKDNQKEEDNIVNLAFDRGWAMQEAQSANVKFKIDLQKTSKTKGGSTSKPRENGQPIKSKKPIKDIAARSQSPCRETEGDIIGSKNLTTNPNTNIMPSSAVHFSSESEDDRSLERVLMKQVSFADQKKRKTEADPKNALLEAVKLGKGKNSITVHKLEQEKLSKILNEGANFDLQAYEDRDLQPMEKGMIRKQKHDLSKMQKQCKRDMEELNDFQKEAKFNRKVLQPAPPKLVKNNTAAEGAPGNERKLAPSGGGSGIQTRYVEQWINDVLRDAAHLEMPGIMKRPEHKKPLDRYEVDRFTLSNMRVPLDKIDRIYRSLFVHSVGFFGLINDATQNVKEGKEVIQCNIWRVFQILLEYACKTDYKLITRKMEELHRKNEDELQAKNAKLTLDYIEKDAELQAKMFRIQQEYNEMDRQKVLFETERMKVYDELHKSQSKLEEEIKLRLFFESKLNHLHHINMTHESRYKLHEEKYVRLEGDHAALQILIKKQMKELEEQGIWRIQAEVKLQDIEQQHADEECSAGHGKTLAHDLALDLQEIRNKFAILQREYDDTDMKLTQSEMELSQLKTDLNNKSSFTDQIKAFYDQAQKEMKERLEKINTQRIQLDEQARRISAQDVDLAVLKRERRRFKEECEESEAKVREINLRVGDLEATTLHQLGLRDELERSLANAIDNTEAIQAQVTELQALKHELERKLTRQVQQTSADKTNLLHLEDMFTKAKAETLRLKQALDDSRQQYARSEQEQVEIGERMAEMERHCDEQMSTLRKGNNLQVQQMEDQQTKIGMLNKVISSAKEEFKKEQDEKSVIILKLEQEKRAHDLTKKHLDQAGKARKELQEEISSLQSDITGLDLDLKAAKEECLRIEDRKVKELEINEDRTNLMERECNRLKMPIEDYKSRIHRLEMNLMKNNQKLGIIEAENKYLSKHYIAYLILKSWSQQRKEFHREQTEKNNKMIADQLAVMEENTKNIEAMNKYKEDLEKCNCQMKEELKILKSDHKILQEKHLELEAKDKKQTQTIAKLEDKLFTPKYPIASQVVTADLEPIVELVERGCQTEDDTKSSKSKKGVTAVTLPEHTPTKLMLKETATGVKKDYNPGDEVPTGWQLIKSKVKKEGAFKTQILKGVAQKSTSNTVSNVQPDTISSSRKSDLDEINNSPPKTIEKQNSSFQKQNISPLELSHRDSAPLQKTLTLTQEVTNRNMDHESTREKVPEVKEEASTIEIPATSTIDNMVNEVVDVSDEEEEEVISQRELQRNETFQGQISPNQLNDELVYQYVANLSKIQVQLLAKRLNTLYWVKMCGGLGMCFNCRNKHISWNGDPHNQHQTSFSIDAQQYFMPSDTLQENVDQMKDANGGSFHHSRSDKSLRLQSKPLNSRQRKYGAYFKAELDKILSPSKAGPELADVQTNSNTLDFITDVSLQGPLSKIPQPQGNSRVTKTLHYDASSTKRHSVAAALKVSKKIETRKVPGSLRSTRYSHQHAEFIGARDIGSHTNALVIDSLYKQYQQKINPAIMMVGSQDKGGLKSYRQAENSRLLLAGNYGNNNTSRVGNSPLRDQASNLRSQSQMLQNRIQKMNEITNIEKLSGQFGEHTEEEQEVSDISPKSKYMEDFGQKSNDARQDMNMDLKLRSNLKPMVTIGNFKASKLKKRDLSMGAKVPQLPLADTTDGSHYGLSRPQTQISAANLHINSGGMNKTATGFMQNKANGPSSYDSTKTHFFAHRAMSQGEFNSANVIQHQYQNSGKSKGIRRLLSNALNRD